MGSPPMGTSTMTLTSCGGFLPTAILSMRMVVGSRQLKSGALRQDLQRGQGLALEYLEESAAAGGDVADILFNAVLRNRRQRVAASGNAESATGGDGARQCLGAVREGVEFEHAHWAVPDDRSGNFELCGQLRRCLRADVEDQVV